MNGSQSGYLEKSVKTDHTCSGVPCIVISVSIRRIPIVRAARWPSASGRMIHGREQAGEACILPSAVTNVSRLLWHQATSLRRKLDVAILIRLRTG
jgi:hypothetical protein